ncbi:MAG: mannose-1-phosphate guanylyltransferase [Bdellovibrionales bacterium]|nr:mannose-1-phosphate guanylyltransferase [Bdellovibrionales bacterium]
MRRRDVAIVILAGGQGSRFWPMSRTDHPKQFLNLGDSHHSLIQSTVERLESLVERENIVVITARHLVNLVHEHVPGVKVLAEPFGRNTAAALALGACWLKAQGFKGAMISLPADHTVAEKKNLISTLERAVAVALSEDQLVTVGIPPERPDTAFGYIQKGAARGEKIFEVKRFFEKPSEDRAKRYLESGDFYWNSGMFAWRPEVYLDALEQFLPEMSLSFKSLHLNREGEPDEGELERVYGEVESISVDFGVMEHAKNVTVVEADPYGWSDVGSWDAWADHFSKDQLGNLLHGDCVAIEGQGNVVSAAGRFIALVGTDDLVVIDSDDAVLICPRSRVQEVKKVVEHLKSIGRDDLV